MFYDYFDNINELLFIFNLEEIRNEVKSKYKQL